MTEASVSQSFDDLKLSSIVCTRLKTKYNSCVLAIFSSRKSNLICWPSTKFGMLTKSEVSYADQVRSMLVTPFGRKLKEEQKFVNDSSAGEDCKYDTKGKNTLCSIKTSEDLEPSLRKFIYPWLIQVIALSETFHRCLKIMQALYSFPRDSLYIELRESMVVTVIVEVGSSLATEVRQSLNAFGCLESEIFCFLDAILALLTFVCSRLLRGILLGRKKKIIFRLLVISMMLLATIGMTCLFI